MKALVQRVSRAAVRVDDLEVAAIGRGMLVLLGVGKDDTAGEAERLAKRLLKLRIFEDRDGRMNEAIGTREILCVSQFTLCADTSRGNRPGWTGAAPRERAEPLYDLVCDRLGAARGVFGADMQVDLTNDGPVTVLLEN